MHKGPYGNTICFKNAKRSGEGTWTWADPAKNWYEWYDKVGNDSQFSHPILLKPKQCRQRLIDTDNLRLLLSYLMLCGSQESFTSSTFAEFGFNSMGATPGIIDINSPDKAALHKILVRQSLLQSNGDSPKKSVNIRYVRGGDGERRCDKCTPEGPWPNFFLDHKRSSRAHYVTKGEFIACLLGTPMLSEVMRLGPCQARRLHSRSVQLNVTMVKVALDENPQQSILCEVYGPSAPGCSPISPSEPGVFLGEAWLPSLSNMDEVLQLQKPDYSENAQPFSSRSKGGRAITGSSPTKTLHISAAWKFPAAVLDNINYACSS